jgi:hypothetical protein
MNRNIIIQNRLFGTKLLIKEKIVVLPIMIMTIINKTQKIDAIVAPAVLQESVELTPQPHTPTPPPSPKNYPDNNGFGTLNKSIGPRFQR